MDRLTAIKELMDRCIRRPNEQYAYSRCEVCGTAFWDREEHRFGCKLLEWRDALRVQSLSQEAVRNEALEEAAEVCDSHADDWLPHHIPEKGTSKNPIYWQQRHKAAERCAELIRALKREPNAAKVQNDSDS